MRLSQQNGSPRFGQWCMVTDRCRFHHLDVGIEVTLVIKQLALAHACRCVSVSSVSVHEDNDDHKERSACTSV